MAHKRFGLVVGAVCLLALPSVLFADGARRQMNVRQGPETVFDQPVETIIRALEGATPTKRNGRVGNEFVFWGYTLADGTAAEFYACAAVAGVNCTARREKICVSSTKVLSENMSMGQVQKLNCQPVCNVTSGSATPCCTGAEQTADLEVGLVSCS